MTNKSGDNSYGANMRAENLVCAYSLSKYDIPNILRDQPAVGLTLQMALGESINTVGKNTKASLTREKKSKFFKKLKTEFTSQKRSQVEKVLKSQYLDHLSSIAEVESTPTDLSSSIDDSQTMSLSQKQRVEMAKMTQSSTKRLSFTGKIGKQLRSLDGSAQKIPKVGIWKDGHLVGVHEDSNSIKYDDIKHHLRDTMSGDNNGSGGSGSGNSNDRYDLDMQDHIQHHPEENPIPKYLIAMAVKQEFDHKLQYIDVDDKVDLDTIWEKSKKSTVVRQRAQSCPELFHEKISLFSEEYMRKEMLSVRIRRASIMQGKIPPPILNIKKRRLSFPSIVSDAHLEATVQTYVQ